MRRVVTGCQRGCPTGRISAAGCGGFRARDHRQTWCMTQRCIGASSWPLLPANWESITQRLTTWSKMRTCISWPVLGQEICGMTYVAAEAVPLCEAWLTPCPRGHMAARDPRRLRASASPTARPSRRAREYDAQHERRRRLALAAYLFTPCPYCHEDMLPGQALDLHHSEPRREVRANVVDVLMHGACHQALERAAGR